MARLSPAFFISAIKMYENKKTRLFLPCNKKEGTPALCNKQEYNKPLSYCKS